MRKALALITTICVTGAIVGCSKANSPAPANNPAPVGEKQASQLSVTLQSKCDAETVASQCVAGYGFTVLNDGNYQLGPGPNGEVRKGTLSAEELAKLNGLLNQLSGNTISSENQVKIEAVKGEDQVTLTRGSNSDVLLKASGTDLTYKLQSAELAQALYANIKGLAQTYYSLPFPDECKDGAVTAQAFMDSIQTCSVDTDCVYVDDNYNAIDSASTQYLTTDDCSLLRPLGAANSTLLTASRDKLIEEFNKIQQACGDKFFKEGCSYEGFNLSGVAPTCKQGVCQVSKPASQ